MTKFVCFNFVFSFVGTICVKNVLAVLAALCVVKRRAMPFPPFFLAGYIGTHAIVSVLRGSSRLPVGALVA